jgi:hypothetical protein
MAGCARIASPNRAARPPTAISTFNTSARIGRRTNSAVEPVSALAGGGVEGGAGGVDWGGA